MQELFLLCFRSCLKGENDNEYYTVLGIEDPSSATTETIKKAYKKKSLSLHPDKLAQRGKEVTVEDKQEFLKVKEAYNVLSDPKRRKLYDDLGLSGLKLMENPSEVDPTILLKNYQKNRGDRVMIILFILIVFASLLILPILFSLKCDGTLGDEAPWVAIWTPMWILDTVQILAATYMLIDDGSGNSNNEDDEVKSADESDTKVPLFDRVFNFITTILFVLLQIFILIKLDNYVSWSWFAVFIPWILYEVVNIVYESKIAFCTIITKPDHDADIGLANEAGEAGGDEDAFMQKIEAESKYFSEVMKQQAARKKVLIHGLRIWLALFIAAQVSEHADWNWGLVLLPIWMYFIIQIIYSCTFRVWAANKMSGLDAEAIQSGEEIDPINITKFQQAGTLTATSNWTCLIILVPLYMAVLLISRLDVTFISTFVIILPVFVGLGCCCCAVFCGVCMLSCVNTDNIEEELRAARGEGNADDSERSGNGAEEQGSSGNDGSEHIGELDNDMEKGNYKPPQSNDEANSESNGSTKTPLKDFQPSDSDPPLTATGIDVDID